VSLLGLLAGNAVAGASSATPEILEPEQAFRLTVLRDDAGNIDLKFLVADGQYLYRDRFKLVANGRQIVASALKWPSGMVKQDPTFGKVVVYRKSVDLHLPASMLGGPGADNALELSVTSQGCADAGFCYPPLRQKITLAAGQRTANPATVNPGLTHSGATAQSWSNAPADRR
jgi:thiol:disulfide interchange protein DsbD